MVDNIFIKVYFLKKPSVFASKVFAEAIYAKIHFLFNKKINKRQLHSLNK